MHPVCFHLGSRPIYWYGVLAAAGFVAAVAHWSVLGRRGPLGGRASDLGLWIMLGGLLGARAAYVIAHAPEFAAHPLDIVRVDKGGLIYYGGFFGGCGAVLLVARAWRQPLGPLADFVVTALPLGHALGRVGCWLNGCCFGRPTDGVLGVAYPPETAPWLEYGGARLHPVQLYETAFNLALYALLTWYFLRRPRPGRVLALYLTVYPIGRFLLEGFRGDPRQALGGLAVAQWISLGLLMAGLTLWWHTRANRRES